jgi:hypothetical protein
LPDGLRAARGYLSAPGYRSAAVTTASSRSETWGATGALTFLPLFIDRGIPTSLTDRTLTFCNNSDPVRDAGRDIDFDVHTSYTPQERRQMADWLATRLPGA